MIYELLLYLQDLRLSAPDFVTELMLFVSSPLVYIALPFAFASFFLWCVDRRRGEWIMMNMATGMFLGHFLKIVFKNPRPWVIDDRIVPEEKALEGANGYSTPSGHSLTGVTGYGSVMALVRNRWAWASLSVLILMILFSRLYLGVHTLFDIIVSIVIALMLMAVNWVLVAKAHEGNDVQVTTVYLLAFIVMTFIWIAITDDLSDLLKYGGFMIGTILGRHVASAYVDYRPKMGSLSVTVGCLLIGWALTGILFLIPYMMFEGDARYCIGGFLSSVCIFVLTPIILKRIGLMS